MAQPSSMPVPSIRNWLSLALPEARFVYPAKERIPNNNPMYTSLVESIRVQEWREAGDLAVLAHLGAERDRPMTNGLAATEPVLLNAFRVLDIEANLQHFFNLSLVYCVNLALHCIYQSSVVILPHVPFTRVTPQDGSSHASKSYTPDYTIFKGHVKQNPALLTSHAASLVVSDVKLYGEAPAKEPVDYTNALSWSDLGQLLWYYVCRKTRFGFCVSDAELVLMEFVVNRSDNITSLDNVVARAKSELSSPRQSIPFRGKPAPGKRRFTKSTTGSAVSPSDRHQHKHGGAASEATESDALAASSPELSSSVPGQPNPRTPELKSMQPYSSDAYVPSTPGEISTQTLQDLASEGGHVIVRLFSFRLRQVDQWAPALFGFIALAKLVDENGEKSICARQVRLQDYII